MTPSLEDLLEKIREKPGIYLGYPNLTHLRFTLSGYQHALSENGCVDHALDGFQDWIANKYRISSSHHWSSIILFYERTEERAFHKFYELYDQFKQKPSN